ncbi:hypothetical protein [Aquimarina sediminis]|uniref:hypothetical protein n=1 Tax=Aquimarina sediminis TaxID=2070536 RepID=UPI000CA0381E|nr:hypothetical protein [Aquimarina sediminis]
MSEKKETTLKTIKDYLPLIYIFLVCFGYFNKTLYYDKFGIDILHYLTIPELVLMFIPVGSMLVSALLFVVILIAPMVVFGNNNDDFESETRKDGSSIYKRLDKMSNNKFGKISKNIYWLVEIMTSVYLNFVPMLLFAYLAIGLKFDNIPYSTKIPIVLMIFWGLIFLLKFIFRSSKTKHNPRLNLFVYLIMMLVCFIVYSDMSLKEAEEILSGKSICYVKFMIDERSVETNKNLLFFGQTNEYVFLRKIDSQENYIYNKKEIKEFVYKKNYSKQ